MIATLEQLVCHPEVMLAGLAATPVVEVNG